MTRSSILIVASGCGVRDAFAAGLAGHGWTDIETCASAADAVRMLVRAVFGVAIVHAQVADMSGIQAVPVIQAADRHAKIVFATPESSAELEARVREAEVFYYYIYDDEGDVEELAAVVAEAIGPPRAEVAKPISVLVVDDDPDFRDSVLAILSSRGHRGTGTSTVSEGLELARALRPDVVLLDIIMETATDGILFSRQLRQDPLIKHTPILAVSSIPGPGGLPYSPRADEELLPVDGFLQKPVEVEVLLRRVEELAQGRRRA